LEIELRGGKERKEKLELGKTGGGTKREEA